MPVVCGAIKSALSTVAQRSLDSKAENSLIGKGSGGACAKMALLNNFPLILYSIHKFVYFPFISIYSHFFHSIFLFHLYISTYSIQKFNYLFFIYFHIFNSKMCPFPIYLHIFHSKICFYFPFTSIYSIQKFIFHSFPYIQFKKLFIYI